MSLIRQINQECIAQYACGRNWIDITFHCCSITLWCVCASCQINKIAGCTCAGNPLRVSEPDMHHGTFVTHVPWCMPGSLTSGFLRSRWRGKRSWHSRRMHNTLFYVTGKKPTEMRSYSFCVRFKVYHIVGEIFPKLILHIPSFFW